MAHEGNDETGGDMQFIPTEPLNKWSVDTVKEWIDCDVRLQCIFNGKIPTPQLLIEFSHKETGENAMAQFGVTENPDRVYLSDCLHAIWLGTGGVRPTGRATSSAFDIPLVRAALSDEALYMIDIHPGIKKFKSADLTDCCIGEQFFVKGNEILWLRKSKDAEWLQSRDVPPTFLPLRLGGHLLCKRATPEQEEVYWDLHPEQQPGYAEPQWDETDNKENEGIAIGSDGAPRARSPSVEASSAAKNMFNRVEKTANASPPAEWSCSQCTYLNAADKVQCEMCGEPQPKKVSSPQPVKPDPPGDLMDEKQQTAHEPGHASSTAAVQNVNEDQKKAQENSALKSQDDQAQENGAFYQAQENSALKEQIAKLSTKNQELQKRNHELEAKAIEHSNVPQDLPQSYVPAQETAKLKNEIRRLKMKINMLHERPQQAAQKKDDGGEAPPVAPFFDHADDDQDREGATIKTSLQLAEEVDKFVQGAIFNSKEMYYENRVQDPTFKDVECAEDQFGLSTVREKTQCPEVQDGADQLQVNRSDIVESKRKPNTDNFDQAVIAPLEKLVKNEDFKGFAEAMLKGTNEHNETHKDEGRGGAQLLQKLLGKYPIENKDHVYSDFVNKFVFQPAKDVLESKWAKLLDEHRQVYLRRHEKVMKNSQDVKDMETRKVECTGEDLKKKRADLEVSLRQLMRHVREMLDFLNDPEASQEIANKLEQKKEEAAKHMSGIQQRATEAIARDEADIRLLSSTKDHLQGCYVKYEKEVEDAFKSLKDDMDTNMTVEKEDNLKRLREVFNDELERITRLKKIQDEMNNIALQQKEVKKQIEDHMKAIGELRDPRMTTLNYHKTQRDCAMAAVKMVEQGLDNIRLKIYEDISQYQHEKRSMEHVYLESHDMFYIQQYEESARRMNLHRTLKSERDKAENKERELFLLGSPMEAQYRKQKEKLQVEMEKVKKEEAAYQLEVAKLDTNQWGQSEKTRFEKYASAASNRAMPGDEDIAYLMRWSGLTKDLLKEHRREHPKAKGLDKAQQIPLALHILNVKRFYEEEKQKRWEMRIRNRAMKNPIDYKRMIESGPYRNRTAQQQTGGDPDEQDPLYNTLEVTLNHQAIAANPDHGNDLMDEKDDSPQDGNDPGAGE